jgi:hypothetical protein
MYLQITPRDEEATGGGGETMVISSDERQCPNFSTCANPLTRRLNPCSTELRVNEFVFKYFAGISRYPIIWQAECTHFIADELKEPYGSEPTISI